MDWQRILQIFREKKEIFERSCKCLNIDRPTGEMAINKHLRNLLACLEEIRIILNVNYERLTTVHKQAAEALE